MNERNLAVHPVYRKKLWRLLVDKKFQGQVQILKGEVFVGVQHKNIILQASIDKLTHILIRSNYQGGTEVEKGVLEGLCRMSPGLPIQEISEHSLIYLEHKLRDHSEMPPVGGIIMPENADPAFKTVQVLIRQLFKQFNKKVGTGFSPNFFARDLSPSWKRLNSDKQLRKAQQCCLRFAKKKSIGIEVVELECPRRIIVEFTTDLEMYGLQELLMESESEVKSELEPNLEVYQKEKKDLNTIRTLNRIIEKSVSRR